MTLPILIALAVVMPFLVLAALWLFSKEMIWLGKRPRTRGLTFIGYGVILLVYSIWEIAGRGLTLGTGCFLLMAVSVIMLGAHDLRRGEVVRFE